SRWGVWVVELAAVSLGSVCAFFFLRRYFHTWPAALAVGGLLVNLAFVLEGGNLTEEYALAFQLPALLLFAREEDSPRPGWYGLGIGVLMGGAFLLKQTLIGIWLALAIYLLAAALLARRGRAWTVIVQMTGGFLLVVLASFAYFAARGALAAYWDVAFWFNMVYSSVSTAERLGSLLDVLAFLNTRSGFFILASTAWFAGIAFILLNHAAALWQATRRRVGALPLLGGLLLVYDGLFQKSLRVASLTSLSLYRWGLIMAGLALLALGGVILAGWGERRVYPWLKRFQMADNSPVVLPVYLAVIDLPVELLVISLSGRGYPHYFISMFPPLAILVAFLVWILWDGARQALDRPDNRRVMLAVCSAALLLPVLYGGVAWSIAKIHPGADRQTMLTAEYIRQNTRPGDTILMWGSQTGLYYLSGRESASRFVHQVPFITPQYATRPRIAEFLGDIQTHKPVLIVDTRQDWFPLPYQSGNPSTCAQTTQPHQPGLETVYQYICAHYAPVKTIGPDSWIIYRYNPVALIAGK
ncbi:MAG TPA: glycosyltransferase family 39 protein, partial [Anaerolineaceae bacterium]